jgi:hypothetical protein
VRDGGGSGTGEVSVAIYRTTGDRDSGVPVKHPVLAELTRIENGVRTTVARSMSSSWSLGDLTPGRYVLKTSKKIDENGDVVPLKGPIEKEFEVQAGERVEAKVVLEKVPVLLIILAVITIVFLVILAIDAAGDVSLPPPPPCRQSSSRSPSRFRWRSLPARTASSPAWRTSSPPRARSSLRAESP